MESLLIRIATTASVGIVGGAAIGGLMMLVRRIQLALRARDRNAEPPAFISSAH
jgi:hypothetical protein